MFPSHHQAPCFHSKRWRLAQPFTTTTQAAWQKKKSKVTLHPKRTDIKEVQLSVFILLGFECGKQQDFYEEASTSKVEYGRVHCTKRRLRDGLAVIHTVSNLFRRIVDYRKYQLANTSSKYDHTVVKTISKMTKRLKAQMKPHTFDLFDPISIIGFVCKFKLACDNNKNHEGIAIWLFYLFMEKSVYFALQWQLASSHMARTRESS